MPTFQERVAEYEAHGSVTCGRCGALPGSPCISKGRPTTPHTARASEASHIEGYLRRKHEDEAHALLIHPDGVDCDVVTHSTVDNPIPWVRRYDVHPAHRPDGRETFSERPYAWCFGVRSSGHQFPWLILGNVHQGRERFHWTVEWYAAGSSWDEGFEDTLSGARRSAELAAAECIEDYLSRAAEPEARLWPDLQSFEDYARTAIDWLRWDPSEPMTARMAAGVATPASTPPDTARPAR